MALGLTGLNSNTLSASSQLLFLYESLVCFKLVFVSNIFLIPSVVFLAF